MDEVFYFDDEAVLSLANQGSRAGLTGYSVEGGRTASTEGRIRTSLRLSGLLRAFGLGGDLGGEGARKAEAKSARREDFVIPREVHYLDVVRSLQTGGRLATNLRSAWREASSTGRSAFFSVEHRFVPEGRLADDEWIDNANRAEFLMLVDTPDRQFRMGMSLSKVVGAHGGHILPVGHLAFRLRRLEGRLLKIFGSVDESRYIKPFVVCYA
jgi:hypothetical protein